MTPLDQHTPGARFRDRAANALSGRPGLGLLFVVALGLRLAALVLLDSASRAQGVAWDWGWETACLAETLLDERPYGDPWGKGTGASAWLPPVYPALVAACMALGGGVTATAAFLLFTLHALISAATCLLLVALGRVLDLARVGLLAGWMFAFYPASLWNAVTNVWDTTLVSFALTGFFVLLLRHGSSPGRRPAVALGTAYGALLMVNPAPLGILPGVLLFVASAPAHGARRALDPARAGLFVLAALALCAPWMIRNQVLLGTPALRSNLGVEFHVGNNDLANGRHQTAFHPSHSERELALYQELGEVAYAGASLDTALAWMRDHPQRTLGLVARRVQIFWVGESPLVDPRTSGTTTAAEDPKAWVKWAFHLTSGVVALAALCLFRRHTREGLLLRTTLFLFPVPYYLTHVMERYRFPIDPMLVFLDVWLVFALVERLRAARAPMQ